MVEKKDKIKKKKLKIFLLSLLILLVLSTIISASLKFGKIDIKFPTGNVDIFDINIYYNDNDEKEISVYDREASNKKNCDRNSQNIDYSEKKFEISDNSSSNDSNSIEDNDVSGTFSISDKYIQWKNSAELRIFENYAFQMKNIIAPGSTNAYNFIVRNNNTFPISYTFSATEDNNYKINLRYRLKQNGKYVIGDDENWVSYDKLVVTDATLSSKEKCLYTLEWKWIDTDHDNVPGTSADAIYKLMINVNASQYVKK